MKGFVIYKAGKAHDTETPIIVILSSRHVFTASDAIRKFARITGCAINQWRSPSTFIKWAEVEVVDSTGTEIIRAQEVTFITVE